jgi:hypothetical protein
MRSFTLLITLLLAAASARAVGTSYWTQTNEADFKSGTLENVVASNLGDLKLSHAVKTLLEQDARISAVNALAEAPDGTLYAGTGPRGVLLAIKGENVSSVIELGEATNIFSLLVDKDGAVLLGTGGEAGRILRIDKPGDKPREIFKADKVQYIWAMARTPDGNLYAATGPEGQLFEIKPDGSHRVLLDSDENNLLCIASDGKDLLYVGTDPHGMIYRINRKTGESFVLYNATETEIAALALDRHGNLYAATAEAQAEGMPARMPRPQQPAAGGRPEGGSTGAQLPSDHPKEPQPPPPPSDDPNRPNPIPRAPGQKVNKIGWTPTRAHHHFGDRKAEWVGQTFLSAIELARGDWIPSEKGWIRSAGQECPALADPKQTRMSAPPVWATTAAPVIFAEDTDPPTDQAPARPPRRRPGQPAPGQMPGNGRNGPGGPAGGGAMQRQPINPNDTGEARAEGNAVYRIDPDGFVTEIFRQDVLILSMVENNGTLLLATGNETEGQVIQVRPAADEMLVLAKVDAKQIMALLPSRDGKIYMGMANAGSLASMSSGFANKGTYTSPVLDATQISRFGKIQLHGTLPPGATLSVATRSGNVKDATERGWSRWSDEMSAAEFVQVTSPAARFLQYRLSFASPDGKATPVVEDVTIAYQIPNLPPQIRSVRIVGNNAGGGMSEHDASGDVEGGAPSPIMAAGPSALHRPHSSRQTINWEASDPNSDALAYSLYFRRIGEEPWILMKDKLTEPSFDWETRAVADGRYEVKVVASDAASNEPGKGKTASRISDPILVDNTPPTIGDLRTKVTGEAVRIDLNAVDRTSTVAAVEYSVDSNRDWQLVLPTDGIYDSPEETVAFTIPSLAAGQHQVTLRATDVKGNQSFESVFVTILPPQRQAAAPGAASARRQ